MDADDDYLLDGVHFVQHVENFVSPPCISQEGFLLEEKVVSVVHVEHWVFLKRILVVTRRQENAEPVLSTGGARERRHQLTNAAVRIFAKIGMNLQGRT
jgi:hypothetical protein